MKIVRHTAYIAQRKRRAKVFALIGFLSLTGTLFLALLPNFLLPSYIAMLAGFVLFNIGMQQVGKWTRNPRNDQLLDHQMKSLPDKFTIVHYPPIGRRRVEHLLVHPGGVLVLTAKEIDGDISARDGRWRRRGGGLRRFLQFSGPQLGNPSFETAAAVGAVEQFLEANQLEVDVEGAVVFVHPQVDLDVEAPDFPVLHGDEIPGFAQSLPVDLSFAPKERDHLLELMRAGEVVEQPSAQPRRRPVKRRAA